MYFDLNNGLNQIRTAVEEQIRRGKFSKYGSTHELLERNSYIYSDLRAALIQKTKTMRSGQAKDYGKFTVTDLENVADTGSMDAKGALSKAYVDEARRAE